MGVETFGISMRFCEREAFDRLWRFLTTTPHIKLSKVDDEGQKSAVGEYSDGRHFIDIQLRAINPTECRLAIRFSLCSYCTIDSLFISLAKDLLSLSEAEVWLMTSALKQKAHYLPGDSQWLIAALPDEIVAMREHWQKLFGFKQGAVRTKDSFSFVGATK
jgi:hypothetical protein